MGEVLGDSVFQMVSGVYHEVPPHCIYSTPVSKLLKSLPLADGVVPFLNGHCHF